MTYQIDKADVWMGFISDTPGALGRVMESLSKAGANLEFVFGRPAAPGQAIFFLAPLKGAAQLRAAQAARLVKCSRILSLRIKGPDKRGLGAKVTRALGESGINLRGLSAMGVAKTALFYIALAKRDLPRAQRILKKTLK